MYATGVTFSNIGSEELLAYMAQNSQVGRATAQAALDAFVKLFKTYVLNGHAIQVPELGTFSLSAKTKSVTNLEEATGDIIKRLRVRFTPAKVVRLNAKSTRFAGITVADDTI